MAKATVREVKILDAVLKEDEGTEDDPKIVQYIWLQLQDLKSERVYSAILSLDDIKDLSNMDRYLEGRELMILPKDINSEFTNELTPP